MKMKTRRKNQSGRSERSEALFTFLKENNKQYLAFAGDHLVNIFILVQSCHKVIHIYLQVNRRLLLTLVIDSLK